VTVGSTFTVSCTRAASFEAYFVLVLVLQRVLDTDFSVQTIGRVL
jgi:hypothetical protein